MAPHLFFTMDSTQVVDVVRLLRDDDVRALADLLGIRRQKGGRSADAFDLLRACLELPKARDALRAYLFDDRCSMTPPRQIIRMTDTPPAAPRLSLYRSNKQAKRHLMFSSGDDE